MAANVKNKILDRPRAKESGQVDAGRTVARRDAPQLRRRGTSNEELLLRWIIGKEDIDLMRANKRPLEYLNSEQPLVNLLQQLSKRTRIGEFMCKPELFSDDGTTRLSAPFTSKVQGSRVQ